MIQRTILLLLFSSFLMVNSFAQEVDLKRGLIAYYPFNENANDFSGNDNHGTEHKVRLEEGARCGSPAYYFDGEEGYLDFGTSDIYNQDFRGLTISAWVKPTDLNREDFGLVIGKWAFREEQDMFGLFFTVKNTLDFSIADGYEFALNLISACGYSNVSYFLNRERHELLIEDAIESLIGVGTA